MDLTRRSSVRVAAALSREREATAADKMPHLIPHHHLQPRTRAQPTVPLMGARAHAHAPAHRPQGSSRNLAAAQSTSTKVGPSSRPLLSSPNHQTRGSSSPSSCLLQRPSPPARLSKSTRPIHLATRRPLRSPSRQARRPLRCTCASRAGQIERPTPSASMVARAEARSPQPTARWFVRSALPAHA